MLNNMGKTLCISI